MMYGGEYGEWEGWQGGGGGGSTYKTHEHFRDPLMISKDTTIYLSSTRGFDDNWKREDRTEVDFGVYLDGSWKRRLVPYYESVVNLPSDVSLPSGFLDSWEKQSTPIIQGMYLQWADRGVPAYNKVQMLLDYLNPLLDKGKRVEIACFGGHGRTGTLAAALMISRNQSKKLDTKGVISYIREVYCKQAIESYEQEKYLYLLNGELPPEQPKSKVVYNSGTKKKDTGVSTESIYNWYFKNPHQRLALEWFKESRKEVEVPTT